MKALCGNKHSKYALQVVKLLQGIKVGDIMDLPRGYDVKANWDLLQYLLNEFIRRTESLEERPLAEREFQVYMTLVTLISKMIS